MTLEDEKEIDFQKIEIFKNDLQCIEKTLKELNDDILKVANVINAKIKNYPKPLSWSLDDDERVEMVKSRGKLVRGDSFNLIKGVLSVYGIEIKLAASQRNVCRKLNEKYHSLCISLTFGNNGNHKSWTNIISDDLSIIYEGSIKGEKTKEDAENDIKYNIHRIVFGKYKDQLGNNRYRFLGVYSCDGYDDIKKAEIWKLFTDSYDLKLLRE